MIDRVIAFIESRTWRLALLPTLTAGVAWAAHTEPQFPQEGQRWFLSVRAADVPGRERFARVYGDPVDGRWAVTVTCGTASLRTGQEKIELRATGMAARSRHGDLGWSWTPVGGGPTGGGAITQERGLSPDVVMAMPCPSGRGDLSSGD